MPLHLTAAHSSRIQKATSRNHSGSPSRAFAGHIRRKPVPKQNRPGKLLLDRDDDPEHEDVEDRLDDIGIVPALGPDIQNATQAVSQLREAMFDELPERPGMNSTRIAEVLNFRRLLPPVVSLAHVQALVGTSARTERQIAEAIQAGELRKISVPARGSGPGSIGDNLVLSRDLEDHVRADSSLEIGVKERFFALLRADPKATGFPSRVLSSTDVGDLLKAGYLTAWAQSRSVTHLDAVGGNPELLKISRAPSGSLAAGGEGLHSDSRGGGGGMTSRSEQRLEQYPATLLISLPNTGPYLRLVTAARSHLMSLLARSRYREMPLYLLRERWDGAVDPDTNASRSKRMRGEIAGVLPGKTKKWRQIYGLRFEWVLGECLAAGLVELFETGSVGRGIRAL